MISQEAVLQILKSVKYPGYSRDIVSFGLIKEIQVEETAVGVLIELTSPNPEVGEQIADAARLALRDGIPGLVDAHVQVKVPTAAQAATGPAPRNRLPHIKRVIAVASGKG
ncbi:MAG: iron-sulfur cluster assembly protein, partial [Limisphaerales bacterium]